MGVNRGRRWTLMVKRHREIMPTNFEMVTMGLENLQRVCSSLILPGCDDLLGSGDFTYRFDKERGYLIKI